LAHRNPSARITCAGGFYYSTGHIVGQVIMNISVTSAFEPAIKYARLVLFRPFEIGKWFTLGFCAWLASFGEGGSMPAFSGSFNFRSGSGGGGRGGSPQSFFEESREWVSSNWEWLVPAVIIGAVILLAISLLVAWLSARGRFMFLDGVVQNRGAVAEPWQRLRKQGNSLFIAQIVLGLISLIGSVVIIGIGALIALPDIQAEQFGSHAVTALVIGVPLFLVWMLCLWVVNVLIGDFIVPVMYVLDLKFIAAWHILKNEIAPGNFWAFVRYCGMVLLIGMALGIIAGLMTCLTCCLAALPYIGTVILLPLLVFRRSYSLFVLQQAGPQWHMIPPNPPAAGPPPTAQPVWNPPPTGNTPYGQQPPEEFLRVEPTDPRQPPGP
jgi:hypothetical protein